MKSNDKGGKIGFFFFFFMDRKGEGTSVGVHGKISFCRNKGKFVTFCRVRVGYDFIIWKVSALDSFV